MDLGNWKHIDVMWSHDTYWCHEMETLPHYWPFLKGILCPPKDSQHKGAIILSFVVLFVDSVNNMLIKLSNYLRFKTERCSNYVRETEKPFRSCFIFNTFPFQVVQMFFGTVERPWKASYRDFSIFVISMCIFCNIKMLPLSNIELSCKNNIERESRCDMRLTNMQSLN